MTGQRVDVTETCRCGATIAVAAQTSYSSATDAARELKAWREHHTHDDWPTPRAYDPIPQGSAATVELAPQHDHDTRPPIGFRAEGTA